MIKKLVSFFFVLVLISLPTKVLAYDYEIDGYDVNIVVNENNVLDISEKISTQFNTPKHGIFRKLPLKNKVVRLDGTTSYNRVKITNINVSDNYTLYNENGYKVIKIGSPDETITGPKAYDLTYSYNIGKDTGKDYDELYFNIIGSEWDTSISNISFKIEMPKEFDESKLGFSSGNVGSTDSSRVYYNVDANTITGEYIGTLNPSEALTVRLELPEGYFVGASNNYDYQMLYALAFCILTVIFAFIIWFLYGRDKRVIETVEFYAPDNLNSAELGYDYYGMADSKDITSLVVYLANKGYLKIVENKEDSSNNFTLIRLKGYYEDNEIEKLFFDGLFKESDIVTCEDLQYKFYTTINKISKILNNKQNKYKLFEKKSLKYTFIISLMTIISFIAITAKPSIEYMGFEILPFVIIFPGVGLIFILSSLFNAKNVGVTNGILSLFFGSLFGLLFGGIPWIFLMLPALLLDSIYLIAYLIGIVCIIILFIILKVMPKRTDYGIKIFGKIKGFKRFLETAEKEKLEALVMEHPTYFYDILPYTYVLGISNKWIEKFQTITVEAPTWYYGSDTFNVTSFGTFMNSTMVSATSAMTSSYSSSSGGSGGGSSGGGSGGGGGGSW